MTLIIGGSGSGKSAYAESLLAEAKVAGAKYYLATMDAQDAESRQRISRHRALRADKGFRTWECPRGLGAAVAAKAEELMGCGVLLECMSNLVANEMFDDAWVAHSSEKARGRSALARAVSDRVVRDVMLLSQACGELFVVTNNVFEDGVNYGETTRAYLDALARVNRELARQSARVVEVVVGIPVRIKEESCR